MNRTNADAGRLTRRALLRAAGAAGAAGIAILPRSASGHLPPAPGTGFAGRAIDLATLQPLAGAVVQANPTKAQAVADQNGAYVLPLPPGTYRVQVAHDQFVGVIRLNQVVATTDYTSLDLDLLPRTPSTDVQQILYQRLVTQIQSPLPSKATLTARALDLTTSGLPPTITVNYGTYSVSVPLEDYVKGVVPNEVSPSWPTEALKAQAVASRSYGVASFLANGFVYPDQRSQVYDPNKRYATTDAAVDATAGQVMTVNGSVIFAFFYSRCNGVSTRNSEDAIAYRGTNSAGQYICANAGWNYVSYCRARCCTWNAPSSRSTCGYFGHGVGMCQWGAFGQAANGNRDYLSILNSYYTGVTIDGPNGAITTSVASVRPEATASFTAFLPNVSNQSCS